MIEVGAEAALRSLGKVAPYVPTKPTTVRFQIVTADVMDTYRKRPGIEIVDAQNVVSRGTDFLEAWLKVAPY
jgi:D-aminopeptidase